MSWNVQRLSFLVVFLITVSGLWAEEPRIKISVKNANELKSDLTSLVGLSPTPELRRQSSTLTETLDAFLEGVDANSSLQMDLFLTADGPKYAGIVPITVFRGAKKSFEQNLKGLGYSLSTVANQPNLFELKEGRKVVGYLREAGNRAIVSERMPDAVIPAVFPGALTTDVHLLYENSAAQQDGRRKTFQAFRKQVEDNVKFKRNEDPAITNVRKLVLNQQLTQSERFIVESERLEANWTTDGASNTGTGTLLLKPLSGTSLATAIAALGTASSRFVAVTMGSNPVVTGKVIMPLDELQTQQLKEFLEQGRVAGKSMYEKETSLSADGRIQGKASVDLLTDVFLESTNQFHTLDGFINLHEVSAGKNQLICAVRAAATSKVQEYLTLIPKIEAGWELAVDFATHEQVKIHKLTIPEKRRKDFQVLLPGEQELLVGIDENTVWGAAGPGALEALKAAIDQSRMPAPSEVSPVWFSFTAKLGPSMDLWELVNSSMLKTGPKSKDEETKQKERDKLRKLGLECAKLGGDLISGDLRREGDSVVGSTTASTGFMRYVGAFVANFTKDNLN